MDLMVAGIDVFRILFCGGEFQLENGEVNSSPSYSTRVATAEELNA